MSGKAGALDLGFVRDWIAAYWLAVWFGVIFAIRAVSIAGHEAGFDARLYLAATRAWLAGQDPWIVLDGIRFAAPPPSLLPLVPIAGLPEALGMAIVIGLAVLGVVATVRMLRLPWWWLLFPPFLDGAWSGNLQTLLVPLILAGAGPLAAFLKLYALVPIALTLRWRAVLVTIGLLAITAPFLPWASYFAQFGALGQALVTQSDGGLSATAIPALIPVAIVALVLCGRERAAWLAVPVIWPSTQWYYATLAVPGLRGAGAAAALMAVPVPGATVLAAVLVAWQMRLWSVSRLAAAWRPTARPTS